MLTKLIKWACYRYAMFVFVMFTMKRSVEVMVCRHLMVVKLQNEVRLLVPFCWLACVSADISIYSIKTHREVDDIDIPDIPARFGTDIPPVGVRALLVAGEPADGCGNMSLPPNVSEPVFPGRWGVLVQRYGCTFEEKARYAQAANFDVMVVHNVNSSSLEPMSANDRTGLYLTAVFIGAAAGSVLQQRFTWDKGYYILIDDDSMFDINTHLLLPFAFVVGMCFCTMLGFMVVKCIKDHRRARRHRLPSSSLRKIPIAKFRKGDPYETCAICLDDFVEEEKLRVLPCSHAYHCKCIDPWLTKNKRVCPVCKRKVFAADEARTRRADSDSDSDSDAGPDDRTPLLAPGAPPRTQGGTFAPAALLRNAWRRRQGQGEGGRRHSAPDGEGNPAAGPSNATPSIQRPGETQVVADINPQVLPTTVTAPAQVLPATVTAPAQVLPTTVMAPAEAPNPFEERHYNEV